MKKREIICRSWHAQRPSKMQKAYRVMLVEQGHTIVIERES